MFGISSFELLVILLVALMVVGPEKMPGIIRRFTKLLSEFRRVKTDFHRTVNLELANLELNEQASPKQPTAPAEQPPAPEALQAEQFPQQPAPVEQPAPDEAAPLPTVDKSEESQSSEADERR